MENMLHLVSNKEKSLFFEFTTKFIKYFYLLSNSVKCNVNPCHFRLNFKTRGLSYNIYILMPLWFPVPIYPVSI